MILLWLCNVPINAIAANAGVRPAFGGGWLDGLSNAVAQCNDITLHYCFFTLDVSSIKSGNAGQIYYHALPQSDAGSIEKASKTLTALLEDVKPDIVHIFGSEFITSHAMVIACQNMNLLDQVLLHTQGLVSVIADHFDLGIPFLWKYLMMPRDFLKNASIIHEKKDFKKRGQFEIETLRRIKHISGRTDLDRALVYSINPQANYYYCNETLRQSFYGHRWEIDKCDRHSIFVSQGSYPIKGLHFMLKALPLILKRYPDACLFVAGIDPTAANGTITMKLKRSSYGTYLKNLIRKYKLKDHVVFTGQLDEQQMRDRYLKSHVFVSPSTIENSPNSLGEAMILGLPCIASYVGGSANMMKDKDEGFFYQVDAHYMLAHYVNTAFGDDELAVRIGNQAQQHATRTHDAKTNLQTLLSIYDSISSIAKK